MTWRKPNCCPSGISCKTWTALAEELQVREVHLLIRPPGFRPKQIVVVTTLLDTSIYTRQKLAQLYLWRWQVEVNLRHAKTTLGMDVLRGKTPEMVQL